MSNIFFTSDLHYGHEKILQLADRPFKSIKEMNEELVENHNSVVKPNDAVYILGDFSFKCCDGLSSKIFKSLNGVKHLIYGNHDSGFVKNMNWESVNNYLTFKNGMDFVLFHYPIEDWDGMYKGSIHLHGHQHNKQNLQYKELSNGKRAFKFDVGVDANGYKPISLDEILNTVKSLTVA